MLVLDAGCGDGKTTEILARSCEVVGCDFSREALLSLRAQRLRDSVVNIVESNLLYLPFEPEKFDAVACIHALSHLLEKERKEAAEELTRVVRVGGHVLVEGFGKGDIRFGEGDEVERTTFLRGNGIVTHYFSEGEIPRLFSGLDLVSELTSHRRVSMGTKSGHREVIRVLMKRAR